MKWSGRTINFLSTLTSQQPGEAAGPVRNAAMPISAFKGVKGLAFIFRKKWGCICSYQRQVGFVTTKIVGADGTITWSPPLFVNGRLFGLGIIIGRQRSGMCLALLNDQAVQTALKGQKLFKLNADFLVDMDGAYLRATNIDSTSADDNVVTDASGNMLARYYRTNAMMIDFSMECETANMRIPPCCILCNKCLNQSNFCLQLLGKRAWEWRLSGISCSPFRSWLRTVHRQLESRLVWRGNGGGGVGGQGAPAH